MDGESESEVQGDGPKPRPGLRGRVIVLHDDPDAFDEEYFAALSPADKMSMIPAMFAEAEGVNDLVIGAFAVGAGVEPAAANAARVFRARVKATERFVVLVRGDRPE